MKIVVDERVFSPDYIPHDLPHRDEQLRQLNEYLSDWLRRPGGSYIRVLVVGRQGSGKTVTIKRFWELTKENSAAKFAYTSCFLNRTFPPTLYTIARQLNLSMPKRGLSKDELISIFIEQLKDKNIYALVVLDDAFNLEISALASFIRMGLEVEKMGDNRLALVVIGHNDSFLDKLDPSTRGIFGKRAVKFPPYTKDQIFDILLQRAELGLAKGSYDEETLEMIADVTGIDGERDDSRGDARLAIDILHRAAYLAQLDKRNKIMPEDVRRASKEVLIGISVEVLRGLPLHVKILLLAIVRALKSKDKSYVMFGEVEEIYQMLCEELKLRPRTHSQLWTYLNQLRDLGLVETRHNKRGEGLRGRTTLISIGTEPLTTLETTMRQLLEEEMK